MGGARITYTPRPDANAEDEINTLPDIYRYILNCKAKKEGGSEPAPEDPERRSNEIRATTSIP